MYWNLDDKDRLFTAFELADHPKLMREFLNNFLTKKEIEFFALRLKAMCMIKDCATYEQIRLMTGLSPTTIARLSKIMADRDCGTQKIIKKFTRKNKKPYFD